MGLLKSPIFCASIVACVNESLTERQLRPASPYNLCQSGNSWQALSATFRNTLFMFSLVLGWHRFPMESRGGTWTPVIVTLYSL